MENHLGQICKFCNFLIDPVLFVDLEGRIAFFNKAAMELTGYTKEELLGKPVLDLVVPEKRKEIVRKLESRKKGIGSKFLYEVEIAKKNGERLYVQVSSTLFELNGKKYIVVVARDISELKRLLILSDLNRELLEQSFHEENLCSFLQKALGVLTSLDWISLERKGAIFLKEDSKLEIVAHLNMADSLLKTCSTIEVGRCLCGRAALGEEIFTTRIDERHEITYDGIVEHGHVVLPIKYKDEILGVLNLYTKPRRKLQKFEREFIRGVAHILALVITRFKFIEMLTDTMRMLKSIRELDRAIASHIDIAKTFDAFAIQLKNFLDFDIACIYSLKEKKLELVATKSFREGLKPKKEIPYEGSLASEALEGKRVIVRVPKGTYSEDRIAREIGMSVYVCAPLIVKNKGVGFLYIASRRRIEYYDKIPLIEELSTQLAIALENYKLYTELKKAYEKLREVDELKSNIVANLRHEILTPVTVIKGALELLDERVRDEDVKEFIATARKYMHKLMDVVEDLVTVSKIYRGEAAFNMEIEDLGEIASESVREKKAYAEENMVEIELQTEKVSVVVDRGAIKKAISNLVDNAIKFNRRGGRVVVKVFRKGDEAVVEVRDTGIGIPEDRLKELFKPLTQLDPSARRKYGGTGTGLAVVKGVVEAHNGRVEVESRVGEGSVFRIYLPIARAE